MCKEVKHVKPEIFTNTELYKSNTRPTFFIEIRNKLQKIDTRQN